MKYEIIRSKRKTLALEVKIDELIIRAPLSVTDEETNNFLLKHKRWIENHLKRVESHQKNL